MKLAEALSKRTDLQKRIEQISSRMDSSARVQEGDSPAEDVKDLLGELTGCLEELQNLIVAINRTNQECTMSDGMTITEKIARRDVLKKHCSVLQGLIRTLESRSDRYSRQEIKYVNTIDVVSVRKIADECSKQLRLTDNEIQAANWIIDLIE